MKRIILIAAAGLLLCSCIYEDLSGCLNTDGSQSDSTSLKAVPVEFCVATEEPSPSKSSISASETTVEELNIYAYYDGKLETSSFIESPSSFKLSLFQGREYNLYVLANMGEIEAPHEESEMSGYLYSIKAVSDISGSFPMAWSYPDYTVSGNSPKVSISLERLISRICFSIDKSALDDFSVTAVKLRQGALKVYPFMSNSKAKSSSDVGDGDYATTSDLSTLNSGGTITLYALENCQGVLLPGNTSAESKIPQEIAEKSVLCTYLEISASFSGKYEGVDVSSDNVVYRFYLGNDNCTDFNLQRNKDIKINLTLSEDRIFDESWKISYGEDLPVISYTLENSTSSSSMKVGGTTALAANYFKVVDGVKDSSTDMTSYAAWTSSDTSIATVSGGVVTAKASGTVVITSTYNGYKATTTISIEDDITYDVYLTPTSTSVMTGRTTKLTAVQRTFTNGVQTYGQDVSSSCTWSSSNTSVVTVGTNGVITGVSTGSATISAIHNGTTLTATVTVTPAYTYELVLSSTSLNLDKGTNKTVTATYKTYVDGVLESSTNVTGNATWTSSSTSVATVNTQGVVTAVGVGSATITATYNGKSATCSVKVTGSPTMSMGWTTATLEKGTTRTNAALYHPNDGTATTNVTSSAVWTTSHTGVATVSGGTITARGAGTCTITATYNGLSTSCTVTVTATEEEEVETHTYVSSLSLQSVNVSGNTYRLELTLKLSDGTTVSNAGYTWKVNYAQNTAIATGTTGTGPLTYTGGGNTYTMAINVTTTGYYYDSSGNYKQFTTGTSFSHNISWTP